MKSVYAKISLWSFATLVLSLFAFVGVTSVVSFQNAHRSGYFGRFGSLELEQAREAYESGGPHEVGRLHRPTAPLRSGQRIFSPTRTAKTC